MCRAVFVQGGAAPGAASAGDEPDGGDDARAAGALGGADRLAAHAEAHGRNHRKHMGPVIALFFSIMSLLSPSSFLFL